MNGYNICAFLCKNCDRDEQSIENIINEIEYVPDSKINMYVVTIATGIKEEKENIFLDYFIRCVRDDDSEEKKAGNKFTYLYSLEVRDKQDENSNKKNTKVSCYEGSMFAVSYDKVSIRFPCKGCFELQVFETNENMSKSAKERYKEYRINGKKPISLFSFNVV